jgi:multimeric flavodoxin WrbA
VKITTILGSPRKSGNTATILKAFEALAAKNHEVARINIAEKNVRGCRGCDACQKILDAPGCRQNDGFSDIAARMLESDIIVYASPVYVWDFPAQMKALIDRHYCLVKWTPAGPKYLMEGRCTALLATCGADAENNADLIQETFRREMEYLHCRIMAKFIVPNCTVPSAFGGRVEEIARKMAVELLS